MSVSDSNYKIEIEINILKNIFEFEKNFKNLV